MFPKLVMTSKAGEAGWRKFQKSRTIAWSTLFSPCPLSLSLSLSLSHYHSLSLSFSSSSSFSFLCVSFSLSLSLSMSLSLSLSMSLSLYLSLSLSLSLSRSFCLFFLTRHDSAKSVCARPCQWPAAFWHALRLCSSDRCTELPLAPRTQHVGCVSQT